MSSYKHFTLDERKFLQELLSEGYSMRKIASFLGRSPSSVSREIKRNRAKYRPHKKIYNSYWYNAWRAQCQYIERRKKNKCTAIIQDSEEWKYVVNNLKRYWSPECISSKWELDNPDKSHISASTIYRYIKKGMFPNINPKTHLRRRGKRKYTRNANYNTIHPDRIIPEWPKEIAERLRVGDWEGDTVYGGLNQGSLVTLVDRRSRYLKAAIIHSRDAVTTRKAIVSLLQDEIVKSINLDNGSEFSEFRQLEKDLDTEIYFAEPHKPWQRGTNENTNDILRFFFPKGFNFKSITQELVDVVVYYINTRPRKCLGWKTPLDVYYSESVALD